MGQIAATVKDAADTRAFECLLPDDVKVSCVAARLAELAGFPTDGCDGYPLTYGFVVKGGGSLDPHSFLDEIMAEGPLVMRLVPEIVAGQGELDIPTEEPVSPDEEQTDPVHIEITQERALVPDLGSGEPVDVRIDAGVHKEIERFAGRDRYCECAGLLLGTVAIEDGERVIHVTAMAAATEAVGCRTSVKMTPAAWESVLHARDVDHPDLRVLGWFHTHAGWGVFMSDADVFIHRHFFAHPDMVAYVLDPTTGRDGFFCWRQGKIGLSQTFGLVGTLDEADHRSRFRWRSGARNVLIALLLMSVIYFGALKPFVLRPGRAKPHHHAVARVTPVAPPQEQVYTIAKGDNLWKVCHRFYKDGELAPALAQYNGIDDLAGLQVGQEIKLPPREVLEKD